jgi:formate hydrogenlyase subunit 3/multisubunit Na+/H+ antiporter MnhD subunit
MIAVLDSPHLVFAPVLLPLATAASMLLMEGQRSTKALLNLISSVVGLLLASSCCASMPRARPPSRSTCPAVAGAVRHRAGGRQLSALMAVLASSVE